MLDALKFAFEILVVAALAVPWLALIHEMFPSNSGFSLRQWLKVVPDLAGDAASGMVVLAFAYFLGSAIERISRNFFNDELWKVVPTERQIREKAYSEAYCKNHLIAELSLPYQNDPAALGKQFDFCPESEKPPHAMHKTPISEQDFRRRVEDMFRMQEGQLLLTGEDKIARLKEYYDQIAVLRGAIFNAFLLFTLSAFGVLRKLRSKWSGKWGLQILTFAPAVLIVVFAIRGLFDHVSFVHGESASLYNRPPLAEFVFLLLGLSGVAIIAKAKQTVSYVRTCIVALILTCISFGAWWWTEVMYDVEVIHSEPVLHLNGQSYTPD